MRHVVFGSWIVAAVCAIGCSAAFKQEMREATQAAANGGWEADATQKPDGKGWHCFRASKPGWSGCYRTDEECQQIRSKNRLEARDLMFSGCETTIAPAACYTLREKVNGEMQPGYECFPSQTGCEDHADGARRRVQNERVSKCVMWD
jgi:hypothetical protein